MKKLCALFLVLMIIASVPGYAQYQDKDERLVEKSFEYGEFDELYSVQTVTLDTDASINFTGVSTATGSTAISVPTNVPFKIKIFNHNVGSLTYTLFESDATGVIQPTATSSHLISPWGEAVVSSKYWEKVFYTAPPMSIGASTSTEVIVECWTRSR